MARILPYVYLTYMFISLYFFFFYMILYHKNKKKLYENPPIKTKRDLTVLIPAWNEESTLAGTVESIEASDYDVRRIIIINDSSTDSTQAIAERLASKYSNITILNNKKNLGKAGSLNRAIGMVTTELVAVVDSQSYLEVDSISKLMGYFENPKVGVATAKILVRNKGKLLERLQALEYSIIAFTRKLLGFVDCIYVTPGPLSIYRMTAIKQTNGFDTKNMTEDIEMTWNLISKGWKVEMNLNSHVETVTPNKIKKWWRQRNRWNMGGLQCLLKYKHTVMNKTYGMLGLFIVPYFT